MDIYQFLLYETCCLWLIAIFYVACHRTRTELEEVRGDRMPPELWAALEP